AQGRRLGTQADGKSAGRERNGSGHRRLPGQVGGTPMKTVIAAGASMAVLVGGIAGYRIGAGTWPSQQPKSPQPTSTQGAARMPIRDRAILYWKHPDGEAEYSQSPKQTVDGRDYVAVYEDQEADVQNDKSAKSKGEGKIHYY